MPQLIGTNPDQLPVCGMLGTAAFVDEAMLVKNTGPQTITANSTSPALTITQDGSGNALEVRDVTGDTTPFVVTADGRVGIGLGTSSVPADAGLMMVGDNEDKSTFYMRRTQTSYGDAPVLAIQKVRGTEASRAAVISGDTLGYVNFTGYDGAGNITAAQITAAVDGTPGANDMPGRLVFSTTADGASSPTERMRIDSNGNVGIGRPPGNKLHVYRDDTGEAAQVQIEQDGTGSATLGFLQTTAYAWLVGQYGSDNSFRIAGSGANLATNERIRLTPSGLVTANNSTGLGYGTGSGGTVTQATSKSTAVTLNKPSGQITMHNEVLAAGSIVSFGLTNSAIAANDVVVFGLGLSGSVTENAYQVWGGTQNGSVVIYVQNISGGSLSEAVVINFCVIKGSTS